MGPATTHPSKFRYLLHYSSSRESENSFASSTQIDAAAKTKFIRAEVVDGGNDKQVVLVNVSDGSLI